MPMERRLQLLLDEERYERLAQAAKHQRVSVAAVIRDAIDASMVPVDRQRSRAADVLLDAEAMEVPAGDDLLGELEELRGARR